MVMTRRLLGRHKHCRSASRNHLGSTKSNCSYAIHALESPQDCRPARPPAPQQVPEESQPPGSGPGRRSERRDASLTPAACLPQQAKTSRRGWAGPPATHWPHVLGRRRLPSSAPATSAGQGAGHSQAALRPEGQMRRHGACRTPSRAQTPWSAGPAHPRKAGQGLSLSRWQGPLPDHCSGLTSLDPPWSPCPLAPQLSVLRRGAQVRDVCARLMAQHVSPIPMLETKRQPEQVLDNSLLRGHSVPPPSPTADGEFRTARRPAASRALYLKQAEGTHTSPRFLRLEEGRGSFALLY